MQQCQQRALATRTACDRCREHKLRCLRPQGRGDGACVRCARAGASCVTGAPRPLGRSRAGPDGNRRRPRHSVFVVSATPPRSATRASLPSAQTPRGPEEPETPALAGSSHEGLVASPPTRDGEGGFARVHGPLTADYGELPSVLFDEGVPGSEETLDDAVFDALDLGFPDGNYDATALPDIVSVYDTRAFPMELEAGFRELNGVGVGDGGGGGGGGGGGQPASSTSLSALPDTHNPSFCVDQSFLPHSPPRGGALDAANRLPLGQPSPGSSSDALVRLTRLNQCVAHQLSRMDAFVIGIPSSPALLDSCVGGVADLQANPILRALESTAELAAIIRQVTPPVQDHRHQGTSSSSSSSSSAAAAAAPSVPAVLMCLSGHMQLLQIYDTIFFHVHRFLGRLRDILGFFEDLPALTHISDLPPVKGDLYINIMIQVTRHNLGSVERALGLPAYLCFSAQRTVSRGLLGGVDSPEPFQSIMGQACSPSEKSGRALVASMRTRIGNILSLLGDDC
ncbi:hypothetical protein LX36DRAFT_302963 [Colletotrichum falcatum]|nr:hypothetical protein LX36DRAFT_302963 [Colletotrichum falcatum]